MPPRPRSSAAAAPAGAHRPPAVALPGEAVDRWFLDREKLAWDWLALDDRLVEEQR